MVAQKQSGLREVPEVPVPVPDSVNSEAQKEEERYERVQEYKRREAFKGQLHGLIIWGVRTIGWLLIIGVLIWAWHILAPTCWHWLSKERIFDIQSIMSSGLLALVISNYANKYLK